MTEGGPGKDNDQGDSGGFLPQHEFFHVMSFAQMETMIRPQDDHGFLAAWGGIQSLHQSPQLVIHELHAGDVGLHPLPVGTGLLPLKVHHSLPKPPRGPLQVQAPAGHSDREKGVGTGREGWGGGWKARGAKRRMGFESPQTKKAGDWDPGSPGLGCRPRWFLRRSSLPPSQRPPIGVSEPYPGARFNLRLGNAAFSWVGIEGLGIVKGSIELMVENLARSHDLVV